LLAEGAGALVCFRVVVHVADRVKAIQAVEALALRILADRLENDEEVPDPGSLSAVMA
jgi:hypothetical protein